MFNRIIVICTGNICRSPMGEILLRQAAPKKMVESAGVSAMTGWGATAEVIEVMQAQGLDASAHRARQLTEKMLAAADLVLTMDAGHGLWMQARFPQYYGKTHKLLKWQGNKDVEDPYGKPVEFFRKTYAEIETGVKDWVQRI